MRFTGRCDLVGPVDCSALVEWIGLIDFEEWPQQHRLADGLIRPSMVTDLEWHGFRAISEPVVQSLMESFEDCVAYQRMVSVVMPSHSIPTHRDEQSKHWFCRVHVPLTTNDKSLFIVDEKSFTLEPGFAYRVNTEAEHSVVNDGDTPRIHFMFDVGAKC